MDLSTIKKDAVYREENFRTPSAAERKIGLWVDRIGSARTAGRPSAFRILGQYAVVFIESGNGYFSTRSVGEVLVTESDVLVLLPDEPHIYFPRTTWTTKWIVWGGPEAGVIEQLGYLSNKRMVIRDVTGAVKRCFDGLSMLMKREDIAAVLERKHIILGMLLELFALSKKPKASMKQSILMEQAIDFIVGNTNMDFSIPLLARHCGLSQTHFRRIFKEYTGRMPREFITAVRMAQAKELLCRGGYTVKQVSQITGYRDPFYFMRVFQKENGVSPGKFSRLHRLVD
jgi:AraC family transcriptional regulator of arabinose operon